MGERILTSSALFSEERRDRILELIRERKKLTVNELCSLLNVSAATVRGDLRDLDRAGLLVRTHGGAIERSRARFEQVSSQRSTEHLAAKQTIAKRAACLVEEGETILLDTGTTTAELAKRLLDLKRLTVVTNDLEIARILEESAGVEVVFLGGTVRKGHHCTVGPAGMRMGQELRVDKAFMATNSLSIEAGATTPDLEQAETKKGMISIARKVIFLCDESKVGRESFARFADLAQIDMLVTEHLAKSTRVRFEEQGIDVLVTAQDLA